MNIPEDFHELHKFVILTANVMFVNGNAFMITSARELKFASIEHISGKTYEQLCRNLNKVIKLYGRGVFTTRVIRMEMEFDKVTELLVNVEVNIVLESTGINSFQDILDRVESQMDSNTIYHFKFQTWNLSMKPV